MGKTATLSAECQSGLNDQIRHEFTASYIYLAMANFCRRVDVALFGAAKYFLRQSNEERSHAQMLVEYLTLRGGVINLKPLPNPPAEKWNSLLEIFRDAQKLEEWNYSVLMELHKVASEANEADMTNFLEENFLRKQVEEIREMKSKCAQLERIGSSGIGIHLFDAELGRGDDDAVSPKN